MPHKDWLEDNTCERSHTCWCCAYKAITEFTLPVLGYSDSTFINRILITTHI